MSLPDDRTVYVSAGKLGSTTGGPAIWHSDAECHQVAAMETVAEPTVVEARERCTRRAGCCLGSEIPTLEDLD